MSVGGRSTRRTSGEVIRSESQSHLAARAVDVRDELDRQYLDAVVSDMNGDVAKAWLNFRRVGEIRYSVTRSARIAGYARLRAVKVDSSGEILQEKASGVEAEIVGGITSRYGGVRGLIERFYMLQKVPGQAFLSAINTKLPGTDLTVPDGYWFWSGSEVAKSGDPQTAARQKQPVSAVLRKFSDANGDQGAFTYKIAPEDFYGRVWTPDPEYVEEAFSPMQAIQGMCEQLSDLRDSISSRLRSRFAHAGILLIPNEIQDAAISGENQPKAGLYSNDKVMNYLIHVMTTNVVNHAQGLASMPILLKGPSAVLDKVKHIIEEATIAETDLKLRAELIEGILMALDQQKQSVKGGEGTSHWGMWAISDEERRITVQPDLDAMCHALTRFIMWPQLMSRGAKGRTAKDAMQWRVWYDLSKASVRANADEDARQLADRGAVSLSYLRMLSGVPDTAAPDTAEYVRWVGGQVKNPILMTYGLEGIEVDWDKAAMWGKTTGPAADSPADDQEAGPGVGDPGSPGSRDSDTPKSKEPG